MATNIEAVNQTASCGYQSRSSQTADIASSNDVSKEVFLQLLVAQIQNQDPLNPMDGAEYVSQLAEFSNLEQMIALGDDVETIRGAMLAEQTESKENPED